jgi:drug/metabolite transporter (DMT)-like permease
MKTNTFILIVSVYSMLLALPAIFAPDFALAYFGGHPGNAHEQSSFNFIGGYQAATGFLGFAAYRSTDKAVRRAWLLAISFLTLFAIVVFFYNLKVRTIPPSQTIYMDIAVWALMALGGLYFWNKEK